MYDSFIASDVSREHNTLGKCKCGEDYLIDEGCAVACDASELTEGE